MEIQKLRATGLVMRNSLSYLHHVFALNEARQPLVNIPAREFANDLAGITIDQCIVPEEGQGWFTEHHALLQDDLPAQVTYTSGTEGLPKGIVLSHANLADAAGRLIREMDLHSDIREYVGVPVTYSFGMGRIRAISAVGGQSYIPPRGFDPMELSRMLREGSVNSLSAVPTLLRILLAAPDVIGDAGGKLRWMEIGSQYMTAAEKLGIRRMFPNARIVQHYGLTEASRTTFLRISEAPEELLESVGQVAGETEVSISGEGRIRIRGPHVARWRIEADRLQELRDSEGWFVTSDTGHMKDGFLYFDGRADDIINCGGVKIDPDMMEARVRKALQSGARVVVAKVPDVLRGEGVLVVAESGNLDVEELRRASCTALNELGLDAGDALHVRLMQSVPQTSTGKPLRRLLTEQFVEQRQHADAPALTSTSRMANKDVLAFFQMSFPGSQVGRKASFESLGGDSLRYIQFSMGLERRFGPMPRGWESLTVAELEDVVAQKRGGIWRQQESATLTRAFFMVCIVALHLDTFSYSSNWGAAYFLYMLAGYSVMRFQWPEINRTGKVRTLFGTILRVAIPTVLVIAAMQVLARTFELKPLLLISNVFDPHEYKVAYYYFAEIYMQLLLLAAALFSIPAIRLAFRNRPILSATIFLVAAMVVSYEIEQVWDTNYIFHRTPHWYAWAFAAGMLMASVRSLPTRVLAMAIVGSAIVMHFGLTSATYYVAGGCALLLFLPEISVPAPAKAIVSEIAGSSMFMYLSHYQVKSLVTRLFHGPMPWLALGGAIVFGIAFARLYNWGEGIVMAHRSLKREV